MLAGHCSEVRVMHAEVEEFVGWVWERHPQYFLGRKVLEVGSLNVNGSVRKFFRRCDYTGIDLGPGPGVDAVMHVADFPKIEARWEVVISCEAMEHDGRWFDSVVAMQRLIVPGGLLLVTCAGPERGVHGFKGMAEECSPHTLDHYRNLSRGDIEPLLHFPAVWRCSPLDTQFYMVKGLE